MARRYLTINEANSVLRRGKSVEVFVGGFSLEGVDYIRWASFSMSGNAVTGLLWESLDQGSDDYLDIYSFDSKSGEYDEPAKVANTESIETAASTLCISELNFVNYGMAQDEYASYLDARK